jgi:hypothetical protein
MELFDKANNRIVNFPEEQAKKILEMPRQGGWRKPTAADRKAVELAKSQTKPTAANAGPNGNKKDTSGANK